MAKKRSLLSFTFGDIKKGVKTQLNNSFFFSVCVHKIYIEKNW